jgi:hypothetical protein
VKAYTPTVASANTSSAVRQPPTETLGRSTLGPMPHMASPHVASTGGSVHVGMTGVKPIHSFDSGAMKMAITHETRSGGVPHMSMHP